MLKIIGIVAAVAVVSSVSVAAIAVNGLASTVQHNTVDLGNEDSTPKLVDISAIEGGVNLLVAGSDTRVDQLSVPDPTDGARNDVTMLMHISEDHQNVSVISFPRDTMVDMPQCTDPADGEVKNAVDHVQINTALGRGGLPCVVATIESITGLTIPYAGLLSFDGVVAMTNVLGGVDVCVAKDIDDPYSQLHLPAGIHTLAGQDALNFLRTREGVGDGSDLARISSQQVYLSSLVRKMLSEGTLGNLVTLYSLANAALTNMQFSSELGKVDSMIAIAKALQGVQLDKVAFLRYPVSEDPDDHNRVVVSESDAHLLNTALANDSALDLSAAGTADSTTIEGDAGSQAPGSPTTDAPATDSPGGAQNPTPDATTPGTVVLPDSFTGQTAAEVSCSIGN